MALRAYLHAEYSEIVYEFLATSGSVSNVATNVRNGHTRAYRFDGTSAAAYGTIDTGAAIGTSPTNFGFAVRPEQNPGSDRIIFAFTQGAPAASYAATTGYALELIHKTDGTLQIKTYDTTGAAVVNATGTATVTLNAWNYAEIAIAFAANDVTGPNGFVAVRLYAGEGDNNDIPQWDILVNDIPKYPLNFYARYLWLGSIDGSGLLFTASDLAATNGPGVNWPLWGAILGVIACSAT